MRFVFIAKHHQAWPLEWMCSVLEVSRSGFHAWLTRAPSARALADAALTPVIDRSFKASDRTYGARRVWRDVLAEGLACGLHKVERLTRRNALRARPRRRGLPKDRAERAAAVAENVLDRAFCQPALNRDPQSAWKRGSGAILVQAGFKLPICKRSAGRLLIRS